MTQARGNADHELRCAAAFLQFASGRVFLANLPRDRLGQDFRLEMLRDLQPMLGKDRLRSIDQAARSAYFELK